MNTPEPRATLRVVTFNDDHEDAVPHDTCEGGYTCICSACRQEVAERVNRGVRRRQQLPRRTAA